MSTDNTAHIKDSQDVNELSRQRDELVQALSDLIDEACIIDGNEFFPYYPLEKAQDILAKYI